jgi:hypothetical protein
MADPARIKRLSTAHAWLRSAAAYVSAAVPESVTRGHVPLADIESALSEADMSLWIDLLVEAAAKHQVRAGFWRDLERAATVLGLSERKSLFHQRFQEALSAVRHTKEGSVDA